jgi:hypothetical protein
VKASIVGFAFCLATIWASIAFAADFGQFVGATEACQNLVTRKGAERSLAKTTELFAAGNFKPAGQIEDASKEVTLSFSPTGDPSDQPIVQALAKDGVTVSLCSVVNLGDSRFAELLGGAMEKGHSPWRKIGTDTDPDVGAGPVYEWKREGQLIRATVHTGVVKGVPIGSITYANATGSH